jgi:hypothetical protein
MKRQWERLKRLEDPQKYFGRPHARIPKPPGNIPKLLGTCSNKVDYVVHHRTLKFYLEMGMKVTKLHRAIVFTEEPILKPYIEGNIAKRVAARTAYEKNFYKLWNNALFGKFLQRVRDRLSLRMCFSGEQVEQYLASNGLVDIIIYGKDLAAAQMQAREVFLNRPIAIGTSILELSKELMYRFYYEQVATHHSLECARVLAGDTDSLMLALTLKSEIAAAGNTIYTAFFSDLVSRGLLDTSNYPATHPLYTNAHAGRLGAFKDEFGGQLVLELVFLRPKNYSFLYQPHASTTTAEINRCKGVGRRVSSTLKHSQYYHALLARELLRVKNRRLASFAQKIYLVEEEKVALSFFDTKRAWTGLNTSLPFGHYQLS